jgi:fatty-acyl-CoA synthase
MRNDSVTVGLLVDRNADLHPQNLAVVCEDSRITYRELKDKVDRVARGFLALGVKEGDRVALLMDNRPEWITVCLAVAKIGAVLVPVNIRYRLHELEYLFGHAKPSVLIMIDHFSKANFIEMFIELCPDLKKQKRGNLRLEKFKSLRQVIAVSERENPGMIRLEEIFDLAQEVSTADLASAQQKVNSQSIVYILYTSGTTAAPKGAILTHGNVCKNGENIAARMHITDRDKFWIPIPLFFSFACANALMTALTKGACLVLQPYFDPEEALKLLEKEGCTILYANPAIYLPMLAHPRLQTFNFSSLRSGIAMGSPQNLRRLVEEMKVSQINSGYGMTETSAICTMTDSHDPLDLRIHTSGRPFPDVEIVIKDPGTEKRTPAGVEGEIRVKGYNVTQGYFDDPEKTAASFDPEGFLRTGDIGLLTQDGYLQFKGRYKDMLKTSGINVSTLEVEGFLESYPGVQEVQVIGIPDEIKEEVGVAFVKVSPGAKVTEKDLIQYCKKNIASYKIPKYFCFADEFPRTGSGKVKKSELRDRFLHDLKTEA